LHFSICSEIRGIATFIAVAIRTAWHCRADFVNAAQPEALLTLFVFAVYFAAEGKELSSPLRQFAFEILPGIAFWFKYNALSSLSGTEGKRLPKGRECILETP
jgi:hypothetical protein